MSIPAPDAIFRLARFGVVGVGCALLYAVLAWSLTTWAGLPATTASVAAYAMAGVASYLGQKLFTFRSDARHADAAPRFLALFAVGAAIAAAAPLLLTQRLGLPPMVAIVFTCVAVPLINYLVLGRLVFRDRADSGGA
jgi:putative flippase GtrA